MLKKADIRIRDAFILPDSATKTYYLYGTTDENMWSDFFRWKKQGKD
ncbi:MAG TPA: hypothetical protein VEY70_21820 [Metabacillus sp.]|nr:hypothetical protein [Metabacillus sp.]